MNAGAEGHEVVDLRTRRALLRRFPYPVLYVLEDQLILVTAVFHGHRDPRRWSERVRDGALRSEIIDVERVYA
jgi:plasmid stabilization system protein ParE